MTDISFGQIEEDFLKRQRYSIGELGYSQGYYRKKALSVKKVCHLAYREDLTERELFAHVRIERGEGKQPRALDRASLDKFQALTFEPYEVELETAHDLFFSSLTGVAYCDMGALSQKHLFMDGEGGLWPKFRRQKSDTLCRVKLLPEAVRLIEQYRSEERSTLFAPITYSRLTSFSSKPCDFGQGALLPFRHTAQEIVLVR